jgi:hypothetical protein
VTLVLLSAISDVFKGKAFPLSISGSTVGTELS